MATMANMGWLRLAAVCGALALGCLEQQAANAAERIFVLSQSGAALSEITEDAEKATRSIQLGKAPAAVVVAPGTSLAYITHPDIGQISVVDVAKGSVERTLAVEGSPFGIAVTKDSRLFVGDWNGAHVSVIDLTGEAPVRKVSVGRAPAHLELTPDEKLLFVANRESNDVSVVRTDDLRIAATIPVGHAPFAMALSPDATRLYVGNVQAGTVSVIDTAKLAVIDTPASGSMPYGAAVTPDGSRVVVTNQQAGTVFVLTRDGGQKPATIKVGDYPEGVVIGADGKRAYVANWFSDDLSVIDLDSLKEIRRVKSPGGPRGVAKIVTAP